MLSIIIPTYNYDCTRLVSELQKQCEEMQAMYGNFKYEILVGDDNSTDAGIAAHNAVIEFLPCCQYLMYGDNMGRALHRNRIIRESRYPWVLVIDADAEVVSDDFILNYWQAAEASPAYDIFVGGLTTPLSVAPGCELRHRYELAVQSRRTLEMRRRVPSDCFSTFNFMASRSVLESVGFDTRCTDYGYEDALFGIEAERQGFRILHIDNPLQHNGINPSAAFLSNSETALRTLMALGPPMTERARVARMAKKMERKHLAPLVRCAFHILHPLLRSHLLSRHPSLKVFAFYKLGFYLTLLKAGQEKASAAHSVS